LDEIASPRQINAAKNYASSGRVIDMSVSPGVIEARVQGRSKTPYPVRLLSLLPDEGTPEKILRKLGEKAIYKSTLLMGEFPAELEEMLRPAGVTQQMCTCPEPDNLCKHIIAVIYVAALAFDRDPFLLLKFRGLDKNLLMEALCAPVGEASSTRTRPGETPGTERRADDGAGEPPARMDAAFYGTHELAVALEANKKSSPESGYPMPLLDFPLWRGDTTYANSIAPYYRAVKKFIEGGES